MLDTIELTESARRARHASTALASLPSSMKDAVLLDLAARLIHETDRILSANASDMADAEAAGMEPAMLCRLLLTGDRLNGMAADVRQIVALPDPIGEEFDARRLHNGLDVRRRRVPLGVIGVIYEARPNVTIDVSALCLKSGNAVILRGGKEARRSSAALVDMVRASLETAGIPVNAVQSIRDPDRELVGEMVRMRGQIDLIVPRGGA